MLFLVSIEPVRATVRVCILCRKKTSKGIGNHPRFQWKAVKNIFRITLNTQRHANENVCELCFSKSIDMSIFIFKNKVCIRQVDHLQLFISFLMVSLVIDSYRISTGKRFYLKTTKHCKRRK